MGVSRSGRPLYLVHSLPVKIWDWIGASLNPNPRTETPPLWPRVFLQRYWCLIEDNVQWVAWNGSYVDLSTIFTNDQGTDCTASRTQEVSKLIGVSQRFSTPRERRNQTLKKMIHLVIRENPNQWHNLINGLAFKWSTCTYGAKDRLSIISVCIKGKPRCWSMVVKGEEVKWNRDSSGISCKTYTLFAKVETKFVIGRTNRTLISILLAIEGIIRWTGDSVSFYAKLLREKVKEFIYNSCD